jgi:hypothetical protein
MSDKIELYIDSSALALSKDSFTEKLGSEEKIFKTEAGTKNRLIQRTGIYGLSVSYVGIESEKVILDAAVKKNSVTVKTWDETTSALVTRTMYIDPQSYSSSLISEDSNHRYYSFKFELVDLS